MNEKKEISVPSDNTRVYIKPQQPIKIHKAGKNEQELNKRKQQFLNANGIKVKIDGSWGPWQEEQYRKLTNNSQFSFADFFTNAMIGASVADNPAVMTASGWKQDQPGNWKQKRTKESDKLASNLAVIGEAAITAPTAVKDIGALYNVVSHPVQSAKTVYNAVDGIPRYIFDHLPYKTIFNIKKGLKNFGKDFKEIIRNPINQNPIAAVKARRYRSNIGKQPRTDVESVGHYKTYSSYQNGKDPIPQIRGRLYDRLQNHDHMYSYPYDGIGIPLVDGINDADYLISSIPVKDYLPFKEVYKLGLGSNPTVFDKMVTAIQTPRNYIKVNMSPAFAADHEFIKINRKALNDFGFDIPTTLSHEYNHALRNIYFKNRGSDVISKESPFFKKQAFDYRHLPKSSRDYLDNFTEIEARGTQLKNYFDTDVLTPDMLKYASQHYVPDTGFDNNMYQFFSGIKDWDKAAEYLTKYSLKNGGKLNNTFPK